jgi:hypothetical protein
MSVVPARASTSSAININPPTSTTDDIACISAPATLGALSAARPASTSPIWLTQK